jgi:phosphoribulokinase
MYKMPKARLVAAGVTLRDQVNKKWPNRDKRSDGWVGDSAHQARKSDHNPDKDGWVHAIDIDENMGSGQGRKGSTAKEFADQLIKYAREGKDRGRLKYVVYEDKIASGTYPNTFWTWRGSGYGHQHHIHVSFTDKAERDGSPFDLTIFSDNNEKPNTPSTYKPFPGSNFVKFGSKNNYVKELQQQLIKKGQKIPAGATGYYGFQTEAAVKLFYRSIGLTSNGKKIGPKAWDRLFDN